MYARVSFYDVGNASRDDAARGFEEATAPIKEMEGNEGGMLLVSASGDGPAMFARYARADKLPGIERSEVRDGPFHNRVRTRT